MLKSTNIDNIVDKNFLFKTIEKKDNIYYIYEIINKDCYKVNKITNFEKFKKLHLLFTILRFNCIKTDKGNLSFILKKYYELLKTVIEPDEIVCF